MSGTLIQFRADENLKKQANEICEEIGIDLSTYMKLCLNRLVKDRGIPFSMFVEDESTKKALWTMGEAGNISKRNGNSNMTLDEINEEIKKARK